MEQYGMTAEEYRGHTLDGTLKTLGEIDTAKDKVMIALALPGMIKNAVKATKDFANGVPVDTSIGAKANNKKRNQIKTKLPINRRQALNQAKDLAGVPRTQQPVKQWVVGDDVTRKGFGNYVYKTNPSHHGRFYEYDTPQGKRVVVEHTNDTAQGLHTHAGKPPDKINNPMNYDLKKGRYQKINREDGDHHIRYK